MNIESINSNSKASDVLNKITLTAREKFQEATKVSIKKKFEEIILPICNEHATRNLTGAEIKLSKLGFTSEQFNDSSRKSFTWITLDDIIKEQGLNMRPYWYHPDCSYCEKCGPGCKPISLYVSWT